MSICNGKADNTEGVTIHKWPNDKLKLEKWKRFASLQVMEEPPKSTGICSRHFKPECFQRYYHVPGQLKLFINDVNDEVVPTILGTTSRGQVSQQATCSVKRKDSPTYEPGTNKKFKSAAERDQETITKEPVSTAEEVLKISVEESPSDPNEWDVIVFPSGESILRHRNDIIGSEEKDKKLLENHEVVSKDGIPEEHDDTSNTYGSTCSFSDSSHDTGLQGVEFQPPFDKIIDIIRNGTHSEESHNFNSTASWSDFGNDLHYSPDENQATIVGDRDHPNLLDNGGHVNLSGSAIPSVSHLTDQVGGSDIVIMPYSTYLYPDDDDNLLPVGDVVLQESSHTNVAGLDTVPEVSHMNVSGPETVPEGSHTNVPGPDSITEVICDSYSDGTMSSPVNIQIPIDDLINGPHHSLPQITNPELESIFAMSDIASAPSIQPIQPSLADVGGHVNLSDIDDVTVPSLNHQVGISDTPIISSPTNMHSEVNNGDHLIPDGDNVDMESRTCTSGNHCRSLHEINCESNSVGDVLTTGSGQISNGQHHPLPQFANQAFPSAIGAQVNTSSTSDGAVPTVLHQVTSQFSTIPVNAAVALAMVPVVLIQPNLENPNNWNPVVIQANNAQVLQLSTSQNSDEKEKRREQNRVSSRKCRKRKRESEEKLFAEEEKLSRENARLRGEVERLSKEIETIKKYWFHQ